MASGEYNDCLVRALSSPPLAAIMLTRDLDAINSGAWVQKFQTGHMTWMTRFNRKLAFYYPDLREKLRRPGGAWDNEWPDWICLGPFKRYILQWDTKLPTTGSGEAAQPGAAVLTRHRMDWCLPDPAAEALQKARKGGRLRAAALGVKGAYIFVPETGPAVWDLAGSYANLKRFLENHSTEIEVRVRSCPLSTLRLTA